MEVKPLAKADIHCIVEPCLGCGICYVKFKRIEGAVLWLKKSICEGDGCNTHVKSKEPYLCTNCQIINKAFGARE